MPDGTAAESGRAASGRRERTSLGKHIASGRGGK